MAGWIKMELGMEVGLAPDHIVVGKDAAPLPKMDTAPNFRPMSGGQTAGWIKMPLGMKVGLGPGPCYMGIQLPPPKKKRGTAANFRPMSIVAKRSPISLVVSYCYS